MLKTVEGVYRNGKIELLEALDEPEPARVIVTVLPKEANGAKLPDMTPAEIAELRWKLAAFEEDWNAPGMEVYDEL